MQMLNSESFEDTAKFYRDNFNYIVDSYVISINGEEIAGCLVIDNILSGLLVHENYRNKGLATSLIKLALIKYPTLKLICRKSIIPFYQKFGFVVIDGYPPDGVTMQIKEIK